jgi:hypothetical protein
MSLRLVPRIRNAIFHYDEWNIGIVASPIEAFLDRSFKCEVRWLKPLPGGKFRADPFAISKGDRIAMLCEEYDYRSSSGTIIGFECRDDGELLSEPKTVIDLPVHASYPYLLKHKDEIYCIPETYQLHEINLYRAQEFPFRWIKVRALLNDIAALDPTIFEFAGYWWLACTNRDDGPLDKLLIWYSTDLFGQWMPHPKNPVKVDLLSSRPAGTPFVYDGQLYRPAQDCSGTYGGRIVLNRVKKLTTIDYEEEQTAFIEPNHNSHYPDGVHTVCAAGPLTILDGKRLVFNRDALARDLRSILKGAKNPMIMQKGDQ